MMTRRPRSIGRHCRTIRIRAHAHPTLRMTIYSPPIPKRRRAIPPGADRKEGVWMPTAPRDDQFVLRGAFSERLTLSGSPVLVYRFLVEADTLLPLVPGVARIVAHDGGTYRLVFAPVGAGSLSFTLELEVRVTGDGERTVTLASIP